MSALSSIQPRQRIIVAVDIEGSTARNNSAKAELRNDMYELLEKALLDCGVTEELREPYFDRGDGAMVLVHPADRVPKTRLLNTFVPTLSGLLEERNSSARQELRLRVAIHSGEVHFDQRGTFGEDIDITVRLLDAPELKQRLRQTRAALVLVVSDYIHRSVIRHGYCGIEERTFEPLVHQQVAGWSHCGWVQVPAEVWSEGDKQVC